MKKKKTLQVSSPGLQKLVDKFDGVNLAKIKPDALLEFMTVIDYLGGYTDKVKREIQDRLIEDGKAVPGYTLVTRKTLIFKSPEAAEKKLYKKFKDEIYQPKRVKTPAQLLTSFGEKEVLKLMTESESQYIKKVKS